MERQKPAVDVIIPTYRPDDTFDALMRMLEKQTYPIGTVFIVNTEERFFPQKGYEERDGVRIRHIKKEEFDHGGTRDGAARALGGDLMLFLTQDAVPADDRLVERLAAAFADETVAAAYARQLPAKGCDPIERSTRNFNYPAQSCVRTKEDLPRCGVKTFFCSDVCAMYRRRAYEETGGFETHTIFNEDMIFAGKLILQGWAVAYVAEAAVIHSHNEKGVRLLRRNFDLGVSQAQHPELFSLASSQSEGIRLVAATARALCRGGKPWLLPSLCVRSACKLVGYRLGKRYKKLPHRLILRLTLQPSYWEREGF